MSLNELAESLGAEDVQGFTEEMVTAGWRVLRRYSPENAVLGAPARSPGKVLWQIAYFASGYPNQVQDQEPSEPRPIVMMSSGLAALEPSAAERRRGLELRWPSSLVEAALPSSIDIVNTNETPVDLSEKELVVVGVITLPGTTEFSFGYGGFNDRQSPQLIAPNQSSRVPVRLNNAGWADLTPGSYELHAVLADMGLQATPLPVELTASIIARRISQLA